MPDDDAGALAARADAAEARLAALEAGGGGACAAALEADLEKARYRVAVLVASVRAGDADLKTALEGDAAAVAALRARVAGRLGLQE
jgi:hypothetical protein